MPPSSSGPGHRWPAGGTAAGRKVNSRDPEYGLRNETPRSGPGREASANRRTGRRMTMSVGLHDRRAGVGAGLQLGAGAQGAGAQTGAQTGLGPERRWSPACTRNGSTKSSPGAAGDLRLLEGIQNAHLFLLDDGRVVATRQPSDPPAQRVYASPCRSNKPATPPRHGWGPLHGRVRPPRRAAAPAAGGGMHPARPRRRWPAAAAGCWPAPCPVPRPTGRSC